MKNLSNDLDLNAAEVWANRQEYKDKMSAEEIQIFNSILKTRQLMYLAAAKKAIDKSYEYFPNTASTPCNDRSGKGDAFRHALWNGFSSLMIGHSLTEQLTTAHENRPPTYLYSYKESEMDLYNNQKGRNVSAYSNLSNITSNILQLHQAGGMRYLNNLSSTCRATDSSVLTNTNN